MNNSTFLNDPSDEASKVDRRGPTHSVTSNKGLFKETNLVTTDKNHELEISATHLKEPQQPYALPKSTALQIKDDKINNATVITDKSEKQRGNEDQFCALTRYEKAYFVVISVLKVILFIVLLYLFLLSLNFMTIGFTMVSGYAIKAGPIIRFLLSNPFAALAIGVVVTAIMQNATATTSIVVSMVGAGIIPDVQSAIPIIMGANMGTCVTNSLIALTLAKDPNEFKRAFGAATLNDMFNLLTISILLPLEILTHTLFNISKKITDMMPFDNIDAIEAANFMAYILDPVRDLFIQLDEFAVDQVAKGGNVTEVALKCCVSAVIEVSVGQSLLDNSTTTSILAENSDNSIKTQAICLEECNYWCMPMLRAFGDGGTGLFWIVISIIVLISCLFGIVKVLSLLIVGPIAKGVNVAINASFPGKMKWFTQVVLFIIALLLTIIVQSSNIITATLVPLCGIGIVTLQRVFVMTLGSNIGTTVTGILTAFTGPPASLRKSMQLAFVYTLFNSLGVLFWLPIPYLRFAKILARGLGNIVFKYRWFLFVYVISVYFLIPLVLFGIALIPHWIGLARFGLPVITLVITILVLKLLRSKAPGILPPFLRDISWLPIFFRSLEPYDRMINRFSCCGKTVSSENVDLITGMHAPSSGYGFTGVVRRLSAIETIVSEARHQVRSNSLTHNDLSDSESGDSNS